MKILENHKTKQLALWVKENAKVINVFAAVFFALTFISGIFWLIGADIEPVAFVLSLCASSLFGLPHLAEFILPSRKPIKDMTHDELLRFIKYSEPKKDWKGISNNWISEVFLLEDPRLRFRAKYIDEGIQNDDFKDKWANRHPDPKAVGYWYDLYYDGNLIDRFILVAVDGARANIPPPDWQTGKIHMMEYKVAQIHDTLGTLDEYILRSKLEVDRDTVGMRKGRAPHSSGVRAIEQMMKKVLRFFFGSVTANILMLIGVVLLSLTLYFGVNPVEATVVHPLIRGTWFHMLLLVTTMPALVVLMFAGDSIVGLVLMFFVQFCVFLALGRVLAFLFSFVAQQKSKNRS